MSAAVYLDDVCYALGSRKLAVADSVAAGRTRTGAGEFVDAGFRYHHLCDDDETAYDLARAAVGAIGDRLGDVDAVVYATCIPANANIAPAARFADSRDVKHLMDFPASRLQAALGLDRAIVVGVNQQACTGMLGSLRLARALIAAEPDIARVLCVSADRFPPGALYEQAYSLISDGAAACVVSRAPGAYRLVGAHHISNGAMVDAGDDETVGSYFTYTHRLVTELLAKTGLSPADVDWVLPQNTHVKTWQILSRLLRIDAARVFCASLPDVAHVISGDNLVNLAYLHDAGLARPGDTLLLVMAGYGMNWQALILEKL
ncbi:MAG TPA: 3-oxoacyl-[acyl-carrier-protein] synthase III C-terminal domain-containing protein [Egibacteraceae bacterium]|nr:3-oxoacyl-[acyl-carrier-protein] synthase III C-terminal domain-containing protein [Egibacteraceae bacterium]